MRVVFVGDTAEVGGAEVLLASIAQHLLKHNHQPAVIIPREGPFHRSLLAAHIPVELVPGCPRMSLSIALRNGQKVPNLLAWLVDVVAGFRWSSRLRTSFTRLNPDVVHTNSLWSHIAGGIAARLSRLPVVWHVHDVVAPSSGLGLHRMLFLVAARVIPDAIVCISDLVATQFDPVPTLKSKTRVLWNVVDTHKFRPVSDAGRGRGGPRPIRIGTVARVTPWKGHKYALEVGRLLKQRAFPFEWMFAGRLEYGLGSYKAYLERLVRQWGLEENVRFVGWVEDMPAFYQSIDLLVHLPIETEPYGLVVAEALSSGVPVIATKGGAVDDLNSSGCVVTVPANRPGSVVETITRLGSCEESLGERKQMARRFAEAKFSTNEYMRELVSIYRGLNGRGRAVA